MIKIKFVFFDIKLVLFGFIKTTDSRKGTKRVMIAQQHPPLRNH